MRGAGYGSQGVVTSPAVRAQAGALPPPAGQAAPARAECRPRVRAPLLRAPAGGSDPRAGGWRAQVAAIGQAGPGG